MSLPNFNLSWNPPDNKPGCPLTLYMVYIKENGQYHINTTTMTNTLSGLPLDCDTEYEFAVSAWNEFGEGNLSQSWQGRVVTGISQCFFYFLFEIFERAEQNKAFILRSLAAGYCYWPLLTERGMISTESFLIRICTVISSLKSTKFIYFANLQSTFVHFLDLVTREYKCWPLS